MNIVRALGGYWYYFYPSFAPGSGHVV